MIITLCVASAATLGFSYAWITPKIYSAKTVIQVEQEEQTAVKIDGVRTEDLKAPEVFKTYEQNILSTEVLLRVIKNHGLMNDPAFRTIAANELMREVYERLRNRELLGASSLDVSSSAPDRAVLDH